MADADQPRPSLAAPQSRERTVGEFLSDPTTLARLQAVGSKSLVPSRLLSIFAQSVRRTPDLAKCTFMSILGCLVACSLFDLEPNTPAQECHIIPRRFRYKTGGKDERGKDVWADGWEATFMFGYRGLHNLIMRNPDIKEVHVNAIHEGDKFRAREGTVTELSFEMDLLGDRGELIGSFCHANFHNGGQKFVVCPRKYIEAARGRSDNYQAAVTGVEKAVASGEAKWIADAQKKLAESPWVRDIDEMAKKTAIRQFAKTVDLGGKAGIAGRLDEALEGRAFRIDQMADLGVAKDIADGALNPFDQRDYDDPDIDGSDASSTGGQAPGTGPRRRGPNKPKPDPKTIEHQPEEQLGQVGQVGHADRDDVEEQERVLSDTAAKARAAMAGQQQDADGATPPVPPPAPPAPPPPAPPPTPPPPPPPAARTQKPADTLAPETPQTRRRAPAFD